MAWQAGGTLTMAARKRRTRPPTSGLEGDDKQFFPWGMAGRPSYIPSTLCRHLTRGPTPCASDGLGRGGLYPLAPLADSLGGGLDPLPS